MKKIMLATVAVVFIFMGANAQQKQTIIPFYPEGGETIVRPVERYMPIPETVRQGCPTVSNTINVLPLPCVPPTPKPQPVYRGGGRKVWNTPKPAPAQNCCSQIWDIRREMADMRDDIWGLKNPTPPVTTTDPNFGAGKDDSKTVGITPPQGGNGTPDWFREIAFWLWAALMTVLFVWALRWLFINPPTTWRSSYGSKESKHDRYEDTVDTKPATPVRSAEDDVKIIEALKSSGGFYHKYADGATKINVPTPQKEKAQKPAVEGKDAPTQAE